MGAKLALAYRHYTFREPVKASEDVAKALKGRLPQDIAKVVRLTEQRQIEPEEVLSAIIGEKSHRLSAIMGHHPEALRSAHPVHRLILKSLIRRTSKGRIETVPSFFGDDTPLQGSFVSIGGPIASSHAKAIFGFRDQASVLPAILPVSFKLHENDPSDDRRAAFMIDGRTVHEEHLLLTSLPMGEERFVNISALTAAGGMAADLVFSDNGIVADLFTLTRGKDGWQALFKVHIANGKPVGIEQEFDVFDVRGVDFDSTDYALNSHSFLTDYEDREISDLIFKEEKLAESQDNKYYSSVTYHIEELEKEKQDLEKRLAAINKELAAARGETPAPQAAFARASTPEINEKRPMWSDKEARAGRNPAQFIRDEYKDELAAGTITRAALRSLDFRLAHAFDNWVQNNTDDKDLLPLAPHVLEQRGREPGSPPRSAAERMAAYRARRKGVT